MTLLNRWILGLHRFPPRNFWSTLVLFSFYSLRQALRAAKREEGDSHLLSHINFKRAHYLEKAMLCEYPKSRELELNHLALRSYLEQPSAKSDDCYSYLEKIAKEYDGYPSNFKCYMLQVPKKLWPSSYPQVLRRLIVQRRSVRQFMSDPVSTELIEKIVEAGAYAPTSCNAQPLHFVSIYDAETLKLVFASGSGSISWAGKVPSAILVLTDSRHYKPFEQHIVMFQDVAAATQNCLLMAEALGLAACWVTLLTDSHILNQELIYERLNIPGYFLIGALIAVGYPSNSVCMVPRRPVSRVLHQGRFGADGTSSKSTSAG